MPNRSSDTLFQLIKSLEKSEKRNFKLYITRNSSSLDLKSIQLFDALDKMEDYDEAQLLNKNKNIRKAQLSNAKAHLYREILSSLRLIRNDDNVDIQLHEQLDYARILYNKGLYLQSLRTLERIKETAREHHQETFLLEVLFFEKTIESLHITRSMQDRADQLADELDGVNERLRLKFRSIWFVGGGVLCGECLRLGLADEIRYSVLPVLIGDGISFFERLGRDVSLHLAEFKGYKNGMVALRYEVRK